MVFEKHIFGVILLLSAVVFIESAAQCTDTENGVLNGCVTPSIVAVSNLTDGQCNLSDNECSVFNDTNKCANKATLTSECRGTLVSVVDNYLAGTRSGCTVGIIDKKCPNIEKLNNRSPAQVVLSLFCLFASVIAGLHFSM